MELDPLADGLVWASLLAVGSFSSLFVLTLVRDLALLAHDVEHDRRRRREARRLDDDVGARAALGAAASAVGALGSIASRLHATGENHAHADASSVIGGGGDASIGYAPTPPTMSAPSATARSTAAAAAAGSHAEPRS